MLRGWRGLYVQNLLAGVDLGQRHPGGNGAGGGLGALQVGVHVIGEALASGQHVKTLGIHVGEQGWGPAAAVEPDQTRRWSPTARRRSGAGGGDRLQRPATAAASADVGGHVVVPSIILVEPFMSPRHSYCIPDPALWLSPRHRD